MVWRAHNEENEMSACPICKGPGEVHISVSCSQHELWREGVPRRLTWEQCAHCGHLFETSGFDRGILADALTQAGTPDPDVISGYRAPWTILFSALDIDIGGKVLDFGCGSGAGGFVAQEFGLWPTFVDMKAEVRMRLRDLGAEDVYASLAEVPAGQFDLVIAGDVIEHIPDPRPTLRELAQFGDWLLVSTPNPVGPLWAALGKQNPYWFEIEHYHIFSPESLDRTLRESGWVVERRMAGLRYLCGTEWLCRREGS